MVKNKALPDSARLCTPPPLRLVSLSLFLSLSLADLALSRLVSRVFSLSLTNAIHPEGTPWILRRLDPSRWPANILGHLFTFILETSSPSGTTQRDEMGRMWEGGSGWGGTHVHSCAPCAPMCTMNQSMVDSCRCMPEKHHNIVKKLPSN